MGGMLYLPLYICCKCNIQVLILVVYWFQIWSKLREVSKAPHPNTMMMCLQDAYGMHVCVTEFVKEILSVKYFYTMLTFTTLYFDILYRKSMDFATDIQEVLYIYIIKLLRYKLLLVSYSKWWNND